MLISSIGGVGIGLVWGWLIILVGSNRTAARRPIVNILAFGLATLLVALQLLWLAEVKTLIFFAAAVAFAFIIHLAWRQSLRAG
jgi:energy-converting hydrogenase Eha subunit E